MTSNTYKKDSVTLEDIMQVLLHFSGTVDQKFSGIDRKFVAIDKKFESIDQRFEQIDQRFEQINKRFEQIDQRFADMDFKITGIRQDIRRIDDNVVILKERFLRLEKRTFEDTSALGKSFIHMNKQIEFLKKKSKKS